MGNLRSLENLGKPTNQFLVADNTLYLNRQLIATSEYLGEDGNYHDNTVQTILFHELCHAADGFIRKETLALFNATLAAPVLKTFQDLSPGADIRHKAAYERFIAPAIEYPAIRATNDFIFSHYHRPPRTLNHSGGRIDSTGAGTHFDTTIFDVETVSPPLCTPRCPSGSLGTRQMD